MAANVESVTDATFERDVLKAETPVLVDFWAAGGGPCRMVAPVLEKVAGQYVGRVKIVKMNVDENQQTSMTYGIRSIPTIALFHKGGGAERTAPPDRWNCCRPHSGPASPTS